MEKYHKMNDSSLFDERLKRVNDALALKEPDRVPCLPMYSAFPYIFAGYSMADILYDSAKARNSIRKYLRHFEPDMSLGYQTSFAGEGFLLEKLAPTWLEWAGRPGSRIDKNSIHQYIEHEYLEDEEYPDFNSDMGGWVLRKYLPRAFRSLEALSGLDFRVGTGYGFGALAMQFVDPDVQKAFTTLTEVGLMTAKLNNEIAQFEIETEKMGFPNLVAATTTTAYDDLSDCLRGTIPSSLDLIDKPKDMLKAIEQFFPGSLFGALAQAEHSLGRVVFIPLHKGMDKFMSDSQYKEFYWDSLLRLVNGLIDANLTPWVYTEGKYFSRIECLMDMPKGKTYIHFEDADMKKAKKLLGDVACLSGGIRTDMLVRGTKDQVADEVKKNIDILAPGGGYIFDLADPMEANCKVENVETMFDTVRTYGKYR